VVHLFRNDGGDGEEVIAGGSERDRQGGILIVILRMKEERSLRVATSMVTMGCRSASTRRFYFYRETGSACVDIASLRSMLSTIFS